MKRLLWSTARPYLIFSRRNILTRYIKYDIIKFYLTNLFIPVMIEKKFLRLRGMEMRIADGVEIVELHKTFMGQIQVIYPTLIWDGEAAVLVDAGFPGQFPLFREAMRKTGIPFEKLNKIILTHQDIDHIGSLPELIQESSHPIQVLASEAEKPYIQGEKMLIKFEAIAKMDSLPEATRKELEPFRPIIENPPKARVNRTVADGEELPDAGGLIVIGTPGHTPGHISLYHKPSKTLIAGDALFIVDGELVGPDPQLTLDMDLVKKSVQKLTHYDIETVICYHGGIYKRDANRRIAELAWS